MSKNKIIRGRPAWGPVVEGYAFVCPDSIVGWNGADVKTGVANGAHGILVLSGETKAGDLENADTVPDAVFTGLKEMAEIMAEMPGK